MLRKVKQMFGLEMDTDTKFVADFFLNGTGAKSIKEIHERRLMPMNHNRKIFNTKEEIK